MYSKKIPDWNSNYRSAIQKFLTFYETRRIISFISKLSPMKPILSQINPVYNLIPLLSDPA
jgi:hypothetical protein